VLPECCFRSAEVKAARHVWQTRMTTAEFMALSEVILCPFGCHSFPSSEILVETIRADRWRSRHPVGDTVRVCLTAKIVDRWRIFFHNRVMHMLQRHSEPLPRPTPSRWVMNLGPLCSSSPLVVRKEIMTGKHTSVI
jgi:hypothetical protein